MFPASGSGCLHQLVDPVFAVELLRVELVEQRHQSGLFALKSSPHYARRQQGALILLGAVHGSTDFRHKVAAGLGLPVPGWDKVPAILVLAGLVVAPLHGSLR